MIRDLHWLIHQEHVIEFANGVLETAKKPLPKPVKAPKPKDSSTAPTDSSAAPAPETTVKAESDPAPAESTESQTSGVTESLAVPSVPVENIVPAEGQPPTPETIPDPAPQGAS